MIFGKLLGGLFGYLLFGPLGIFIGFLLGHAFDKGLSLNLHWSAESDPTFEAEDGSAAVSSQSAFFQATFAIMGHIAKIDGRINEQEIAVARSIMRQMQLSETQTQEAIVWFQRGKEDDFQLHPMLTRLQEECGRHFQLKQLFLEIQVQAVLVDGQMHPSEYEVLRSLSKVLQMPRFVLDQIIVRTEAMYGNSRHDFESRSYSYSSRSSSHSSSSSSSSSKLQDSYHILGVKASDSDADIKKAYRRLMNEHHPDKLVAKGLPPEMMKMATEKTQKIQEAYDIVEKARK